jgi:hypothetical protein
MDLSPEFVLFHVYSSIKRLRSIPARLQKIVSKILPYVYPAFIHNLCDFKDFLGFS